VTTANVIASGQLHSRADRRAAASACQKAGAGAACLSATPIYDENEGSASRAEARPPPISPAR